MVSGFQNIYIFDVSTYGIYIKKTLTCDIDFLVRFLYGKYYGEFVWSRIWFLNMVYFKNKSYFNLWFGYYVLCTWLTLWSFENLRIQSGGFFWYVGTWNIF